MIPDEDKLRRLLRGDPKELRAFARPAIVMGLVCWTFTLAAAVSHFVYDAPIRDRYTGGDITIGQKYVSFGGGALLGALLIAAGIFISRRRRER